MGNKTSRASLMGAGVTASWPFAVAVVLRFMRATKGGGGTLILAGFIATTLAYVSGFVGNMILQKQRCEKEGIQATVAATSALAPAITTALAFGLVFLTLRGTRECPVGERFYLRDAPKLGRMATLTPNTVLVAGGVGTLLTFFGAWVGGMDAVYRTCKFEC